jgi:hypothetical protein
MKLKKRVKFFLATAAFCAAVAPIVYLSTHDKVSFYLWILSSGSLLLLAVIAHAENQR